ncbi:hypothetical protein BTR23_09220 [Alkalihalophilus pseudofirmus]|nr:hypothetical protein BTR23_09220 [Alkalihalophilus pseudofirmus]
MSNINKILKLTIYISFIIILWLTFFGFQLIGYVASIHERSLRLTACGTIGCNDLEFFFSVFWTVSIFIIIPLVIPIFVMSYLLFKN